MTRSQKKCLRAVVRQCLGNSFSYGTYYDWLQELTDTKHKLEAQVRDLTMKQSSLDADNERLTVNLQTIRQDYTSLGSDRTEQERELTHIRMKLAVMEQDLKMKDEQLMRVSEELSFERDAKVGRSILHREPQKCATLFSIIILAFLVRFLQFLYQ